MVISLYSSVSAHGNEGKTFEELLKEKKILDSVPQELRGIWRGKMIFQPRGDKQERDDTIDMCQYPIKFLIKERWKSSDKWEIYYDFHAIKSYRWLTVRGRSFFDIDFEPFKNGRGTAYNYHLSYYPKLEILTEENYADNNELRWKIEYKRLPCPNKKQ